MKMRTMFGVAFGAFVAAMSLPGCSDDPETENNDQKPADDSKFCQALFDRDTACGLMPEPSQVQECTAKWVCNRNLYRAEAVAPSQKCIVERDCMTSMDSCVSTVAATMPETASTKAFEAACLPRLAECNMEGNPFLDDYCYGFELAQDSVIDELTACLSQPCAMISDCLSGTFGAILAPCGGK
ncbi:hypothetical protein [Polyangium sp. 15x6]|uniref:hypothetical protein n=1 Tax=Polyangium sp. 15x6 TaxID=3042687 RepID=UPI00249CA497|nr:hypothetical protein [Polyangium sp. 15x6]MDI3286006.1 hypothetical protein [Polyangium sp. 15x6]